METFITLLIIVEIILVCKLISFDKNSETNNQFVIDFKFAYFQDLETPRFVKKIIARERKTYVAENGYVYFINSNKAVHRWVMEKNLGKKLNYREVVHHIDGDKQNNKINNLKLFPNQEAHDKYHREHLRQYGTWYEEIPVYPAFIKQRIYAK